MCLCMCILYAEGARGGLKRELDPAEVELQAIVNHPIWVLGTKIQSSGRASTPNH